MHEFIGLVIVVSILAGAWAIGTLKERKRLRNLEAFAEDCGLELLPTPTADDIKKFFGLAYPKHDGIGRCGNTFIADNGQTRVVLFDYEIKTGSGKSEKKRNFVLSLITDGRMRLPVLRVSQQTLTSKLFDMVNKKTIPIESDSAFNSEFHVTGPIAEDVINFLTASNREHFRQARFPCVELKGDCCLLELSKKKMTAETARKHLSDSLAFCAPWRSTPQA